MVSGGGFTMVGVQSKLDIPTSEGFLYHTPGGHGILLGAERQLYSHSVAVVVDLLADDDLDFGVTP